jgi:hypothetical protein
VPLGLVVQLVHCHAGRGAPTGDMGTDQAPTLTDAELRTRLAVLAALVPARRFR